MTKRIINDILNRLDQLEQDVKILECEQGRGHSFRYHHHHCTDFHSCDYIFRCVVCYKEIVKSNKQLTDAEKESLKTLNLL